MRTAAFLTTASFLVAFSHGTALATDGPVRFTKDDFAAYLTALDAHDYDAFTRYYTSDVRLYQPDGQVLDRDGIVTFERSAAEVWDWRMDVQQIVIDDEGIALRARMYGPFRVDAPEIFGPGPSGSPKAGEIWQDEFVMLYKLRDAKIAELHFADIGFKRL